MNLAPRYPALAVDNADSYMYFAENTPSLSMDTGSGNSSRCSNSAKLWIHKAYIGYYGRCGEFGGSILVRPLGHGGGNLSSIIAAFGTSQEYTNRFSGLSDSELINNLYRNMFNRDAEPGPSGIGFGSLWIPD